MRDTGPTPTTDRMILPGFATAAVFAMGAIASAGFERLMLAVVAAMFTLVLLLIRSRGTSLHGAVRVATTLFGALVTAGGSFGMFAGAPSAATRRHRARHGHVQHRRARVARRETTPELRVAR